MRLADYDCSEMPMGNVRAMFGQGCSELDSRDEVGCL